MAEISKMVKEIRDRTLSEDQGYIRKNMAIVDEVYTILRRKNMKPVELARRMGKSPSELSKWLSGSHNLTLQSIARMEAALEEDIIITNSYSSHMPGAKQHPGWVQNST